jgi:hypothetical protein
MLGLDQPSSVNVHTALVSSLPEPRFRLVVEVIGSFLWLCYRTAAIFKVPMLKAIFCEEGFKIRLSYRKFLHSDAAFPPAQPS